MVDKYFWEDLLAFIEEKSVVPIIGQELVTITIDGKKTPLYNYLAEQLADRLDIKPSDLPQNPTLNHVAYKFLQNQDNRREKMYVRMKTILDETPISPPEPLKKLARIKDFKLLINTTFDPLLENAINDVWFGGKKKTKTCSFALEKSEDIPGSDRWDGTSPLIYYLLGRVTVNPNYVITEEDTLEFIHSLQSDTKRPHRLFDELKEKQLLFIGTSYSNWLARFFIRTIKNERLTSRGKDTIIADTVASHDKNLVLFLKSPLSYATKIFDGESAEEFVNELYSRWSKQNILSGDVKHPDTSIKITSAEMEPGAIFLSYASEDLDLVKTLKEHTEQAGLDVWFDKQQLEAGDAFDEKIRRNINNCSLFIPIISKNTETRMEGYFRREWKLALERQMEIADSVPFIIPFFLDDIPKEDIPDNLQYVPPLFLKKQISHFVDGKPSKDFINRLITLVREFRKRNRGPS